MRSRVSIRACVRPSVRRSICRSGFLSIRWSVHPLVTHELKPCKSAVFDQNYYLYERERILCRVSGLVCLFHRFCFLFLPFAQRGRSISDHLITVGQFEVINFRARTIFTSSNFCHLPFGNRKKPLTAFRHQLYE